MTPPVAGFGTTATVWTAGEIATSASGNGWFGVVVTIVSALGGVMAAYVATRGRSRRKRRDDEVTISRREYDRLRRVERHDRRGE